MLRTCWKVALCSTILMLPLISCQGQPHKSPLSPGESAFTPAEVIAQQSSYEGVAAEFALNIDAASGTAEATPIPLRAGQKQGFIFDLDISSFLTKDSFRISGVERQLDGDLEIFFTHAHPFGAPDFTRPVSGTNRADLGYTGRAVILADRSTNSFFGGTITLDPTTVADADGYANVAPLLLSTAGLTNNTFPYVLLADEAEDNRVGMPNGGVEGNYNAAGGGWDRLNIGANRNGWTGYDFVHQGQTIRNSITITQDALQDGDLSLRVALVIKYCDPRGGATPVEQKPNRIPPSPADPLKFAYRLPHAALDVSSMHQTGAPVGLHTNINNCTALTFTLRDWDVLGVDGNDDDLSDDTSVETLIPGSDALPAVVLDAPFLSPVPRGAILTGYDQGLPGAELQMGIVLRNELASAPAGNYYACLRAEDPENAFDEAYHYGVDPVTLAATRTPLYNTYLPIPVTMTVPPANAASTAPQIYSLPCEAGGPPLATRIFAIQATNTPTTINWDFGGGANPNVTTGNNAIVTLAPTPGIYVGTVSASNAFGSSGPKQFIFEVSGTDLDNPPPHITVRSEGVIQSGDGLLVVEVTEYSSPLPGSVSIQFDWNNDGDYADTGEASQPLSGPVPIPYISPITYNSTSPVETLRNLPYRYLYTTVGSNLSGLHQFRLGANRPPEPTGSPLLAASTIAQNGFFTISTGTASAIDPEGDPITYKAYDNLNPTNVLASNPTFPLVVGPYNGTPSNVVELTIFATDPAHPTRDLAYAFSPTLTGYVMRGAAIRWQNSGVDNVYKLVVSGSTSVIGTGARGPFDCNNGAQPNCMHPNMSLGNANGNCMWSSIHFTNGACGGYTNGVAVAPNGNVGQGSYYYAGAHRGGLDVLSASGTPLFEKNILAGNGTTCFALDFDSASNVYAAYTLSAETVNFGAGPRTGVGWDLHLVKYSPTGTYLAERNVTNTGDCMSSEMHIDDSDNVYVAVRFDSPINFGGGVRTPTGGQDVAIVKYNTSLVYQWDRPLQSAGGDHISDLATDASGNIYAAGSVGGDINLGGGIRTLPPATTTGFLLKLTSAGTWIWDRTYPGTGASSVTVALTSAGLPVLGCSWSNNCNFGGGVRSSAGLYDCNVVRLDASGNFLDEDFFGGTGQDSIRDIGVASDGTLRVVGQFSNTVDFFSGPGVFNMTAFSVNSDTFWLRLAADGSL